MKLTNYLLLLTIFGFISCANNGENEKDLQNSVTTVRHENESIDNGVLHLNNGAKWTVNDATHVGMSNIQNLLIDYMKNDIRDNIALAQAMSTEASTLISKCDMVGIDHDQLHLILHPILESIDAIKLDASMESIKKLTDELNTYFNHFQTEK